MRAIHRAWLPIALVTLSCASLGSPKVPDTPDGTVRFVAAGLTEMRPQGTESTVKRHGSTCGRNTRTQQSQI